MPLLRYVEPLAQHALSSASGVHALCSRAFSPLEKEYKRLRKLPWWRTLEGARGMTARRGKSGMEASLRSSQNIVEKEPHISREVCDESYTCTQRHQYICTYRPQSGETDSMSRALRPAASICSVYHRVLSLETGTAGRLKVELQTTCGHESCGRVCLRRGARVQYSAATKENARCR